MATKISDKLINTNKHFWRRCRGLDSTLHQVHTTACLASSDRMRCLVSGHLLHRASGQPCDSFSCRGQIPDASDLNSRRVRSHLKHRRRDKYRTRQVPMSDASGLPETSTFNMFLNTLVSMCQHQSVSPLVHVC